MTDGLPSYAALLQPFSSEGIHGSCSFPVDVINVFNVSSVGKVYIRGIGLELDDRTGL